MDIGNALRALVGAPHLVALRPRGPVLVLTEQGRVLDIRNGNPRIYQGKLADYAGIDWQVIPGAQLAKMAQGAEEPPKEG